MVYPSFHIIRADSRLACAQPSETSLQANAVSHWLGASLVSALYHVAYTFFSPWELNSIYHGLHASTGIGTNPVVIYFRHHIFRHDGHPPRVRHCRRQTPKTWTCINHLLCGIKCIIWLPYFPTAPTQINDGIYNEEINLVCDRDFHYMELCLGDNCEVQNKSLYAVN